MTMQKQVSILILGAGWTSTFLLPLLQQEGVSHAATTTTGRDGTLKFHFDGSSFALEPYRALPAATSVLITFPLRGPQQSARLITLYQQTHASMSPAPQFIQLGSTGLFSVPGQTLWVTRRSAYDVQDRRAVAEDELLGLGGCVLNMAGLWGAGRRPRDWVSRVAASKEALRAKSSLHVIHGEDVARAILAVSREFTPGERWILTDLLVYDWWALILGWSGGEEGDGVRKEPLEQLGWIQELMAEADLKALPRSMEQLGRCYDSREFWSKFKIMPVKARL